MVAAPTPLPPPARRRGVDAARVKAAALEQLAEGGAEGLALRAVARRVGVSVQALYHYFDSRDALVTALVADAFTALAAAVARAADDAGPALRDRVVAAGLAYRTWAVEHRSAFLLALGTPLPGYAAPEHGPTTAAARAMSRAFAQAVFAGWTPAELAALPAPGRAVPPGGDGAAGAPGRRMPELPAGAVAALVDGWVGLHGVVVLELLGHLDWTGASGEDTCRDVLLRYADRLATARAASGR